MIGAASIIVTRENFKDMRTISKCLPEVKPVADEASQVLSPAKMLVLSYHLPGAIRLNKWTLLFSPRRDGYSPLTFFERAEEYEETLLVVKDTQNYVFGAFSTERWRD
mmetsp:Transcript_18983/g.23522  ORF Transcript_18983/g.23522 Transcript_18983/m.23522 type:complete len:108 (+) Transcript_18983:89-412(+)